MSDSGDVNRASANPADGSRSDAAATPGFRTQAYERLCESYHAIESFRGVLLGALPLAAGTGIVVLVKDELFQDGGPKPWVASVLEPLGVFGFLVTLGLASYEAYGIRRCTALILAGQRLEKELGLNKKTGPFLGRPPAIVNEPMASGIVYGAVLAAWTYLALWTNHRNYTALCALVVLGGCLTWMKATQKSAELMSGPPPDSEP